MTVTATTTLRPVITRGLTSFRKSTAPIGSARTSFRSTTTNLLDLQRQGQRALGVARRADWYGDSGAGVCLATNDEVNNMSFYNYVLINQGTQTLTNTYMAQWVDVDLGGHVDDYVGVDVRRGLPAATTGTSSTNPPATPSVTAKTRRPWGWTSLKGLPRCRRH